MNTEEKWRIMAENYEDGIELPEELLELVTGGVIDSSHRRKIKEFADGSRDMA